MINVRDNTINNTMQYAFGSSFFFFFFFFFFFHFFFVTFYDNSQYEGGGGGVEVTDEKITSFHADHQFKRKGTGNVDRGRGGFVTRPSSATEEF